MIRKVAGIVIEILCALIYHPAGVKKLALMMSDNPHLSSLRHTEIVGVNGSGKSHTVTKMIGCLADRELEAYSLPDLDPMLFAGCTRMNWVVRKFVPPSMGGRVRRCVLRRALSELYATVDMGDDHWFSRTRIMADSYDGHGLAFEYFEQVLIKMLLAQHIRDRGVLVESAVIFRLVDVIAQEVVAGSLSYEDAVQDLVYYCRFAPVPLSILHIIVQSDVAVDRIHDRGSGRHFSLASGSARGVVGHLAVIDNLNHVVVRQLAGRGCKVISMDNNEGLQRFDRRIEEAANEVASLVEAC